MSFWTNFWDLIGWFFSAFVLFAYLMVIFSIVGDLLRDRALSGWYKALWVIFLVLVPILTALVYLIARGRGMAERQVKAVSAAQDATDTYIRDVAGHSPADEISKAKALKDSGTITDAEFEAMKAKAIAHP
jgi:hypothetical protein